VLLVLGGISNALNPNTTGSESSPTPSAIAEATAAPTATPTEVSVESSATAPATPAPTAAPTPTATAEPTAKPTPIPPVLKTSGRGDKVVKFAAQDEPTIATITNKGGTNFAVISYAGSAYGDLLVNEIGAYKGTVYIEPGINRLKVTSSSSWTIVVRPINQARHWDGTSKLSGTGDSVVWLTGASSGITTITNKSRSNFAVVAHSPEGEYLDLLVNDIGAYHGEVLLPDADPMVLQVHAVGGTWSMSAVSQ
jgi:hypothetical protein